MCLISQAALCFDSGHKGLKLITILRKFRLLYKLFIFRAVISEDDDLMLIAAFPIFLPYYLVYAVDCLFNDLLECFNSQPHRASNCPCAINGYDCSNYVAFCLNIVPFQHRLVNFFTIVEIFKCLEHFLMLTLCCLPCFLNLYTIFLTTGFPKFFKSLQQIVIIYLPDLFLGKHFHGDYHLVRTSLPLSCSSAIHLYKLFLFAWYISLDHMHSSLLVDLAIIYHKIGPSCHCICGQSNPAPRARVTYKRASCLGRRRLTYLAYISRILGQI
jgi:hypothetical protein